MACIFNNLFTIKDRLLGWKGKTLDKQKHIKKLNFSFAIDDCEFLMSFIVLLAFQNRLAKNRFNVDELGPKICTRSFVGFFWLGYFWRNFSAFEMRWISIPTEVHKRILHVLAPCKSNFSIIYFPIFILSFKIECCRAESSLKSGSKAFKSFTHVCYDKRLPFPPKTARSSQQDNTVL